MSGDFIEIKQGNACALVLRKQADIISSALFDGAGCRPLDAAGRGAMTQFPLGDGRTGILRVCRRGGLLRRLVKEGFLLRNRPLEEFHVHQAARARGIPAPALLGVRWGRRGTFYFGALATELLPGCDLDAWLRANAENPESTAVTLQRCGATIRHMHDNGVYHADLQLKNIFVADNGIFLLDFDRARLHDALSTTQRARNLLRLRRSFEKRGHPVENWRALLDRYGDITFPFYLDAAYRVKAWFSDMIQGRRTMQV